MRYYMFPPALLTSANGQKNRCLLSTYFPFIQAPVNMQATDLSLSPQAKAWNKPAWTPPKVWNAAKINQPNWSADTWARNKRSSPLPLRFPGWLLYSDNWLINNMLFYLYFYTLFPHTKRKVNTKTPFFPEWNLSQKTHDNSITYLLNEFFFMFQLIYLHMKGFHIHTQGKWIQKGTRIWLCIKKVFIKSTEEE